MRWTSTSAKLADGQRCYVGTQTGKVVQSVGDGREIAPRVLVEFSDHTLKWFDRDRVSAAVVRRNG